MGPAFLDLPDITGVVFFVVRIVLGVLAGFVAWLAGGPLVRLLYRLAFHRPAPALPVTVGRLGLGILVGVLVFLYFPVGGLGLGWGWGPGSGGGPGAGPGPGGTALGGSGEKGKTGKIEPTTPDKGQTKRGKDVLTVELVTSKRYEPGSRRYYLVDGKGMPRTLAEVEAILKQGKGRWGQVRIVVYANAGYSDSEVGDHPAVTALKQLATRYGLPWEEPDEYHKKMKTFPDKGG
jgi:hypothetical protein